MPNIDYMQNEEKEYYGDKIMTFLLKLNPKLTKVQIRRLCCNLYQRLYIKKDNIYEHTKRRLDK